MKKKVLFVGLLVALSLVFAAGCGKKTSSDDAGSTVEDEREYSEITWPFCEMAGLLPAPESDMASVYWENYTGFVVYISETTKEQYADYVNACQEAGFKEQYQKGDDYYYAYNSDGYDLSVKYEGDDIMFIRLDAPDEEDTEESSEETTSESESATSENQEENAQKEESEKTDTSNETGAAEETSDSEDQSDAQTSNGSDTGGSGIRADFKEAMDSYEAFMDEYVDFMKKYESSDDTIGLLSDYLEYISEYADMAAKLDAVDTDELSTEELEYYLDVVNRVSKKLLEIAE